MMDARERGNELLALGRPHTARAGNVVFEVGDPV